MEAKPFKLGYVGVGLMGLPMVQRLAGLGWRVRAYDIVPERVAQSGAQACASAAGVASEADVVLLNLPTNDAVIDAMFSPRGAVKTLRPPQLVVDFSTIPVEACRAHAARLETETGCRWVDAPVSGGPPASGAGTLTVMAGGTEADIARLAPLMRDIAGRCTRVGPVGAGLAAKMINQLVVGVGHAMLAEAVALCEKAGIDAARIPDCLAGGYADSNLMQAYWPRMAQRDFAPRGYVRQLLKDLEMVAKWGGALEATTPMLTQALFLYRELAKRGHAELDSSAIRKLYD
ncbi:MAG TPA: NAD(P)-dependent oxidoreductase [Burkholderiales bacterium]|jgi:3-hydroxyisobutyrate dehydrogenase-like beta-hydroxyacid dehydrogenase